MLQGGNYHHFNKKGALDLQPDTLLGSSSNRKLEKSSELTSPISQSESRGRAAAGDGKTRISALKLSAAVTTPSPGFKINKIKVNKIEGEKEEVDEIDRIPTNINFEYQHKILQSQVTQLINKAKV